MDQTDLKGIPGIGRARIVSAAFALAAAALIIVQSTCLAWAVTALWGGASLGEAGGAVIGFFAAYACRLGVAALQERAAARFAENASAELRRAYLDALGSAGPELSHRLGLAACVLNATEGIASVRDYLADAVPKKASLMVVPLCLAVAICCFDVLSGIIAFICLPLIMVFMQLIGHTASDDAARRHAGFTQMSNHFLDALRGLSTLRAFGRAATYGKTVFAASEGYRRHVMRTLRTATLSSTVLDIFATCGLAAVAIMLGFRMVDGEVLFFPALAVLLLVPEFFMPIRAYARGYHATLEGASALGALERALLLADEQAALEVEYESMESELALDRAISTPGVPKLRLDGVSIAHGRRHHVLSKVGFSLAGAHLVVVTGPSGAGKSSLLDVLAGFADPSSGRIFVNGEEAETLRRPDWHGRVSYIPQRPHLFNATLKENVAFYRPDATDDEVMSALREVGLGWLAEGEHGLDLMLGEGGRGLSGGEAHRIALARSLVDPARDVIVLDEPTAHVDIETELQLKKVFLRAFEGKLVIMATHNMHWVRAADMHLAVGEGTVEVRCTEAALRQEENAASAHPSERQRHAHVLPQAASDVERGEDARIAAAPELHDARAAGARLIRSLLRTNAPLIVCAMVLAFAAALFAGGLMFTSGYMISVAASLPVTVLALHLPSIFVRIFGVGKPLLDYVQRLLSHDWILRATSALREKLFEAARRAFECARPERLSEMLATLSDDIARTQDLFIRCALPYVLALLLVVVASCAAGAFSLPFGIALFVLLAMATVGLSVAALVTDGRLKDEEAAGERALYAVLTDDVMGLRDIVLAGRGRERAQQVLKAHAMCERIRAKLGARRRARSFVCQLLVGCAILLCLIWAAAAFTPSVPTPQSLSPAAHALAGFAVQNESPCPQNWITAFAICLFPLIEFLLPATEVLLDGSVMCKGADRIGALLESASPGTASSGTGPSAVQAPACDREVRDAGNAVEACIPSLRYPDAAHDVLTGVMINIPRGSRTAIIGPSGAGKTTLVRAIAHDLPFAVPGVRADGSVGLIEQESYLFNKSLRENLLIANGEADDAELEEALRRVGLSGLLERLPKGLDTVLASGGEDVSGGEATRIAVARALLAGFSTIVLDEPFCALDADTEAEVMATIEEALAGKTVIVVTHHLQGVSAFDHVVFVEGGRITMQGAPACLAVSDPRFRALLECTDGTSQIA